MRISDWSSDVCSSDLAERLFQQPRPGEGRTGAGQGQEGARQARIDQGTRLEARQAAPAERTRMSDPQSGDPRTRDPKSRDKAAVMNWIRRNSPTREDLLASRFIRPFAPRVAPSHLWRFTRPSVPRGTALCLLVRQFVVLGKTVSLRV